MIINVKSDKLNIDKAKKTQKVILLEAASMVFILFCNNIKEINSMSSVMMSLKSLYDITVKPWFFVY